MKAKSVSLWVIVLAGIWVAALSLLKSVFPAMTGAELGLGVAEIIATGVFFVVIFTPVYRSIWLDKKLGAQVEEAKVGGGNMDRWMELVADALKESAGTKGLRTQGEIDLVGHLHRLSDKDKTSGQDEPSGVAAGG